MKSLIAPMAANTTPLRCHPEPRRWRRIPWDNPFMSRPLLALFLAALCSAAAAQDEAKRFERDVTILAANDMEGRGLGTAGIEKAAAFIEQRLRDLKLQPAFGASYRQPFPVKIGVSLAPGNRLAGL